MAANRRFSRASKSRRTPAGFPISHETQNRALKCRYITRLSVGSQQAGPKVAAILSVVESCRRLKIPIREYLSAVLPGLADFPLQRIKARTPPAWAAAR